MEPDDLLCSRNARSQTPLVGRAQWKINQPPSLERTSKLGLSGLMLCCPMISHKKGYPFEVVIVDELEQTSVVLADQVKSLDWKVRKAVKKGTAPSEVITETLRKLPALL